MNKLLKLIAILAFAASGQAIATAPIHVTLGFNEDSGQSNPITYQDNTGAPTVTFDQVLHTFTNDSEVLGIKLTAKTPANYAFATLSSVRFFKLTEPGGLSDFVAARTQEAGTNENAIYSKILEVAFISDGFARSDVPPWALDLDTNTEATFLGSAPETGSLQAIVGTIDPYVGQSLIAGNGGVNAASDVVEVIPEPEIYVMMGIGLALMGWVGRHRKQQAAAA